MSGKQIYMVVHSYHDECVHDANAELFPNKEAALRFYEAIIDREKAIFGDVAFTEQGDLDDAYGRYSTAKAIAWRDCERRCTERNGYGLSVIGHNSSYFSAGFTYRNEKGKMFYVMTPSYDGEICVEDYQNEIL